MRTRLSAICFLVLGLVLALTWAVAAQQSPENSELGHPTGVEPDRQTFPSSPGSSSPGATTAMTLGQPGLTFRYIQTFGVTEEPYPADAQHFNHPNGILVDDGDNLYVAEEYGQRVLKFNAAGANQLIVGYVGLPFHGGGYLSYPKDVAVDSDGHFWVVSSNAVNEFGADGSVVQWFPEADPWNSGSDNEHFSDPAGIAFDIAERMYVSDQWNHRIQVYTFTAEGAPVYSSTIGVTGESGLDNDHFNQPQHIAVYGDSLYIADAWNHRVQIFEIGASSLTYSTTIGVSGESGNDNDHLNWPSGVAVNASHIYVSDKDNHRIQVFDRATRAYAATIGTGVGPGNTEFRNPYDVAVDSVGNIYVADWDNARIQKFDSGRVYQRTYGVTGTHYMTDTTRLNGPWGITVTADGSIYATEAYGARLVKMNAAGVQQWTIGQPGGWGDDNAHFGAWWPGPQGNPAVDASGRVYVPDTGNHRIQIFNSNGTYSTTLGSYGIGPYEFDQPTGIAISLVNGDIYVADRNNHRIEVYSSSRVYKATLGVPGETGTDNQHFNWPSGVAVEQSGKIYVADRHNNRVQKCTLSGSSYTCTTFAGVTGECGTDFEHLCFPQAVVVDTAGRVYVADDEHRLQVFDSAGAYLTTLGGAWGPNTGQMRNPGGVAVDGAGNVYVADTNNHRIQKFVPGVPGWRQVNINGFGDRNSGAWPWAGVSGSRLYVAMGNFDTGVEVWRTDEGGGWNQVNADGFGDANNTIAYGMVDFGGHFYVGTRNDVTGGEMWRTANGTTWEQVNSDGFGSANNIDVQPGAVLGGYLYADTSDWTAGCEVWRTANGTTWEQVSSGGFGDANNGGCSWQQVFGDQIYVGTFNSATGGELWRSTNGTIWEQVGGDGFGDSNNWDLVPLIEYDGYLYVGTYNVATGAEIWRSEDGTNWAQINDDGFGGAHYYGTFDAMAAVFDGELYVGAANDIDGMGLWKTRDGTTWSQVLVGGWGDSNNGMGTLTTFNNRLYIGTQNGANGGEVWMMLHRVYLPVVMRNH